MPNPRRTRTHAADSAPGVGDGRAGVTPPPVNSKPRGRGMVWIGLILAGLVALAAFLSRPTGAGRPNNTQGAPAAAQQATPPQGGGY